LGNNKKNKNHCINGGNQTIVNPMTGFCREDFENKLMQ
jgi:hypothetical protein